MKYFLIFCFIALYACHTVKYNYDGETAMKLKKYASAIHLLKEEFGDENRNQLKAYKATLLGNCYTQVQDYNKAVEWYGIAQKLDNSDKNKFLLAQALLYRGDYGNSVQLLESISPNFSEKTKVNALIFYCRDALQQLKTQNNPIVIDELDANSSFSDFGVSVFDDETVLFVSNRKESTGSQLDKWTGQKFYDIFQYDVINNEVIKYDALFNSDNNEGPICFNKLKNKVYFTRCYTFEGELNTTCKIMESSLQDGLWSEAQALPFNQSGINYGNPTLFDHDSILIFSTDLDQEAKGKELYYAELGQDGWSTQIFALPKTINSFGNENFPTVYKDTLFFSSDGWSGYGNLDIFKTYLKVDTWQTPTNLGFGINSGADDFGIVFLNDERNGYFSSNRNVEEKDNIFHFSVQKGIPAPDIETPDKASATKNLVYLAIKTFEVSNDNRKLAIDNVRVDFNNSFIKMTNKNGLLITKISRDSVYAVTATKEGFFPGNLLLNIGEMHSLGNDVTINREIELKRIEYNKEIVIDNIYFDFDKADIRPDAGIILDELFANLSSIKYEQIIVKAYTDCRGDTNYNLDLSNARARAVVNYLVSKGLAFDKIFSIGLGESQPVQNCVCEQCSESQHQLNRRITFQISSK